MRWLFGLTVVIVLFLVAETTTTTDTPIASVFGSSVTVRPDQALPTGGTSRAVVAAARNESASFQVALRAPGVSIPDVRAAVTGALTGPHGATIPSAAVTLAREAYYQVDVPTDGEGATGRWPDELIPDRDPLLDGDGGAFPFHLSAHDTATLWVDVNVPPRAVAGAYHGRLRITSRKATLTEIPIRLTVRPFVLPSTSSLRSIFMLNPYDVCRAPHDGYDGGYVDISSSGGCDPSNERTWKVFSRFAQLGLRDRISIANPYPTPVMRAPSVREPVTSDPPRPAAPTTTAAAFDRYVKPLLDGTAAQGTLPGAKLTAITTQWACIRDPGPGRNCLRDWKSFLAVHDRSAAARFLPWVCDEPSYRPTPADTSHQTPWSSLVHGASTSKYAPCESLRAKARVGWPNVPVKVTTPISDPGLYPGRRVASAQPNPDTVDVLVPNVDDLVTRATGNMRRLYDPFLRHSVTELWLYISCSSGGCDPGRTDPAAIAQSAYGGWPSYSIDQPGSQASAMGWMAFLYRIGGESYFDVASGFDKGPAFHHGIDSFGTNGDGQLFYPGRVQVREGSRTTTEDMPFESIRLKRIREGREDYEYLHLVESCGHRDDALSVVEDLFGDPDHAMFQTTVSQTQLDAARQDLADLIERYECR